MTLLQHLLAVCAMPSDRYTDVTCTTDGHYLATAKNDIGFNVFLGRPSPYPSPQTTAHVWKAFRACPDKRGLIRLARSRNIDLRDFLFRRPLCSICRQRHGLETLHASE